MKKNKAETTSAVHIESGFEDEGVKSAIALMGANATIHNRHEGVWRAIQQLFEAEFTVWNPSGDRQISSKLLLQIIWKVVNKMKIPDFKIYRAGPFALSNNAAEVKKDAMIRDQVEQIVTAGVATVMKEGRFVDCMGSKGGAFFKGSLFGDCHIQIGYDEDKSDYPIAFRVGSLSDVYMNNSCTDIRDPTGGLSADEVVIIYRYTVPQFESLFPDWAGKVAIGDIPRNNKYVKQLEKTWLQTTYRSGNMIEVGYRIGIDKCMVVFAGPLCTVLDKFEGDGENESDDGRSYIDPDKIGKKAFPFMMDGKPYIPLLHFKFFPSTEGYYNYGIGHMVFDIAVVMARMDNMAYSHANSNIRPITFVNTPYKNASKLFNEILRADEARQNGGNGYVVSENAQGQGSGVTVEAFQSPPITGEWERAFTRLERQIERLGFKLDMPDLGANPNEMSIMADQEATDAPIKQIIEFNRPFFEEAVNFTMDAIRKFVSDEDETPLNSTIDIEMGDAQIPLRGIPLGWVAQELRKNKYFVVVNSRDGTVPTNTMENARISKIKADLPPGTPAWNKLKIKEAKLNGQSITMEDLMPAQAPAPGGGGAPMEGDVPTETTPLNAATLKHGS